MTAVAPEVIPYEQQHERRSCGAAALYMVYRSLGLPATQSEIWERVARPGPWGTPRTNTKRLVADAHTLGLAALVLKASQPWPLLQQCAANDLRVILNHLLTSGSPAGHYSVLVGVTDDHVVLHDPAGRPDRRLSKAELQDLWGPARGRSETAGHVLVAIAAAPQGAPCQRCRTEIPALVACPTCRQAIPLQPAAALGCVQPGCPARLWERLFCPSCDRPLSTLVELIADG